MKNKNKNKNLIEDKTSSALTTPNNESRGIETPSLSESELSEIVSIIEKATDPMNPKNEIHSVSTLNTISTAAPDSLTDAKQEDEQSHHSKLDPLKTAGSGSSKNDYFDDDEEFLRAADSVVHSDDQIALFKQEDNVVSWEIVNFYKENGKPRSKYALRNDPPLMKISSSSGDSAEFLVTKNFSKSLGDLMNDVNKAYYGMQPNSKKKALTQESLKDKTRNAWQWIKEHKIKAAAGGVVIALILASLFIL